jgi:hypothetical protein
MMRQTFTGWIRSFLSDLGLLATKNGSPIHPLKSANMIKYAARRDYMTHYESCFNGCCGFAFTLWVTCSFFWWWQPPTLSSTLWNLQGLCLQTWSKSKRHLFGHRTTRYHGDPLDWNNVVYNIGESLLIFFGDGKVMHYSSSTLPGKKDRRRITENHLRAQQWAANIINIIYHNLMCVIYIYSYIYIHIHIYIFISYIISSLFAEVSWHGVPMSPGWW